MIARLTWLTFMHLKTDNERQTFFVTVDDFISTEHENIIAGDFNCIAIQRLDKCGGNPNARHLEAGTLQAIICTQYNLTDVWRDRHKDERNYTWTGRHPINGSFICTRIDKCIISRTINHLSLTPPSNLLCIPTMTMYL